MNPQTDHNQNEKRMLQLDRLAMGEISPAERRDLIQWLDADDSRWRNCALVLLEARELAQVFGDWKAEPLQHQRSLQPEQVAPILRKANSQWIHRIVLAASLLAAFGLGMGTNLIRSVSDPVPAGHSSRDIVTQPVDPAAEDRTGTAVPVDPAPQPNVPAEKALMAKSDSDNITDDFIPDYVRSQLERRGYRVNSRPNVVSVAFPDGHNEDLPVNQVQFSYVGQRSY